MTSEQWITAGIPFAAVVIARVRNEVALSSVERHLSSRIDSLEKLMDARFKVVDERFETARQGLLRVEGILDARLKHLEER